MALTLIPANPLGTSSQAHLFAMRLIRGGHLTGCGCLLHVHPDFVLSNSSMNSDFSKHFSAVCDEKFYMVGFMSFYNLPDEGFLPCEIGAVEYSLNGGILRKMHYFIKPGLSKCNKLCVLYSDLRTYSSLVYFSNQE